MRHTGFHHLERFVRSCSAHRISGEIRALCEASVEVEGLARYLRIGDRVRLRRRDGKEIGAEVTALDGDIARVFPEDRIQGFAPGDRVELIGQGVIFPDVSWVNNVLDAFGRPLDGGALAIGPLAYPLRRDAPPALRRKPLGARLETGLSVFNTFLPIVRGQRVGVFAGSGVGKTSLLGKFARALAADVVVLVLIGERGREVREFVDRVLGPEALKRCVVVAATSDQSPAIKRRAAWTGLAIAEFFRDQNAHVLFMVDSVTRFAEAHREVCAASGEAMSARGFPATTASQVMELVERAGPGTEGTGDITALFTVLVAGSDLDEPIADLLRGVLDGHAVLSREIANRGRFPSVDVLKSLSRSLPEAASDAENALLGGARRVLAKFESTRIMVEAGLYTAGADAEMDRAVRIAPRLDDFFATVEARNSGESFARLASIMEAG